MVKFPFRQAHPLVRKWAQPLVFGKGPITEAIRTQSPLVNRQIRTPLPCLNPVSAFVFRTKYEKSPELRLVRHLVKTDDGGCLGVDKMERDGVEGDPDKPIVVVFPGGNEVSISTKIQTLCAKYLDASYGDVFMCNYRGKFKTPLLTAQLTFQNGRFNDVYQVVNYIADLYPDRKILISADCFGGSCALDYLLTSSYAPVNENVIGCVAHSVQMNLIETNKGILTEPGYSLFVKNYNKYLQHVLTHDRYGSVGLPDMVRKKMGDKLYETMEKLELDTIDDHTQLYMGFSVLLDNAFTSPEDYIYQTSPHCKLQRASLTRPMVIINSQDDFTAPVSQEDIEIFEKDPNLCFWLNPNGGHCSYVRTMYPTVTNYIDEMVVNCSDILVAHSEAEEKKEDESVCEQAMD
eukprot:sb/3465286/